MVIVPINWLSLSMGTMNDSSSSPEIGQGDDPRMTLNVRLIHQHVRDMDWLLRHCNATQGDLRVSTDGVFPQELDVCGRQVPFSDRAKLIFFV